MIIGLTGGIGSGKTTACGFFREWGAFTLSADELAHEALASADCRRKILAVFGRGVLTEEETINRKKLGSIVFNNRTNLRHLENIIHPVARALKQQRIAEILRHSPAALIFYEVPLLFEKQMRPDVDRSMVIETSEALRMERVKHSRQMTTEEILYRMQNQLGDAERRRLSDFMVTNNGDLATFRTGCRRVFDQISEIPADQRPKRPTTAKRRLFRS